MKTTVKSLVIGISLVGFFSGSIVANDAIGRSGNPMKNKIENKNSISSNLNLKSSDEHLEAISNSLTEKYNIKFDIQKTISVKNLNSETDQLERDNISAFDDTMSRTYNVKFNVDDLISVKNELCAER